MELKVVCGCGQKYKFDVEQTAKDTGAGYLTVPGKNFVNIGQHVQTIVLEDGAKNRKDAGEAEAAKEKRGHDDGDFQFAA